MSEVNVAGFLGKKIFFLHPSALVQNQVVPELVQDEFEVYTVKDEDRLKQGLTKYPGAIVFICLNEGMKETACEEWIRGVMGTPETAGVQIGVISAGRDDTLKQKYIDQYKVPCGFIVMRSDISMVIKQFITILNSVSAKGRRKYLRAIIEKETNVTVNIPLNGTFVNGTIRDISVVGFSCSFPEDPHLPKNTIYKDVQLRLQSQLLRVEGLAFGSRLDGEQRIYVILFTQHIDSNAKSRIRKYIQSNIQSKMDVEL